MAGRAPRPARAAARSARELVGHRRAIGLVLGKQVVAEGLALGVEDHGDMLGLVFVEQLEQHVDHAEHAPTGSSRLLVSGGRAWKARYRYEEPSTSTSGLSLIGRHPRTGFAAPQFRRGFAPAHQAGLGAGRPSPRRRAAGVVVRTHGETVGAGIGDGQQLAGASARRRSRARKSPVSHTGPTTSTGSGPGSPPCAHRQDVVPGVVQRRPDQVVHGRIHQQRISARGPASYPRRVSSSRPARRSPGPARARSRGRARRAPRARPRRTLPAVGARRPAWSMPSPPPASTCFSRRPPACRRATKSASCSSAAASGSSAHHLRADVAGDAVEPDPGSDCARDTSSAASSSATPNLCSRRPVEMWR
jgi:hypothetical protein